MKSDIHPGVERLVLECIGRIRGRFMFEEQEAKDEIAKVLKKAPPKLNPYGLEPAHEPWKPGDPKPETP